MLRLQRREHGRQRHEGGDKDPEGDGGDQRHRKAMAKVLRNVVKRQAGERHPDAAEPAHHLHPAQFFPEDPPQHVYVVAFFLCAFIRVEQPGFSHKEATAREQVEFS